MQIRPVQNCPRTKSHNKRNRPPTQSSTSTKDDQFAHQITFFKKIHHKPLTTPETPMTPADFSEDPDADPPGDCPAQPNNDPRRKPNLT